MKREVNENQVGILLTGLDGSNPLAFLAAIGAANVLSRQATIEIGWTMLDGIWFPCVNSSKVIESFADTLYGLLATELIAPWNLSKKLPFESVSLRSGMVKSLREIQSKGRTVVDTFAAFGSEAHCDENGQFQDTAFRMVRSGDSAGQGLPDYACKLAKRCAIEDIEAALFGPWTYSNSLSSFRWDPAENREYALQSINPSKEGSPTPIGSNRLAIEALTLYPTMPGPRGLETVGFIKSSRGKEAEFRWPIWDIPLGIDTIRSLLTCPQLFTKGNNSEQLRAMGVASVFCSRQIKPNQYYRNFTPSFQV